MTAVVQLRPLHDCLTGIKIIVPTAVSRTVTKLTTDLWPDIRGDVDIEVRRPLYRLFRLLCLGSLSIHMGRSPCCRDATYNARFVYGAHHKTKHSPLFKEVTICGECGDVLHLSTYSTSYGD